MDGLVAPELLIELFHRDAVTMAWLWLAAVLGQYVHFERPITPTEQWVVISDLGEIRR